MAAIEAALTTQRQSRPPTAPSARKRWGSAEPTVSAPMRVPIARPRPRRNQPAMSFTATG
jgi:hypothetical protein